MIPGPVVPYLPTYLFSIQYFFSEASQLCHPCTLGLYYDARVLAVSQLTVPLNNSEIILKFHVTAEYDD